MHTVVRFFAILSKNHASTQTSHAFVFGKPLLFTSPEKNIYLAREKTEIYLCSSKVTGFFEDKYMDFRLWRRYIRLMGKNWAFV
jgi:hypothetical protein